MSDQKKRRNYKAELEQANALIKELAKDLQEDRRRLRMVTSDLDHHKRTASRVEKSLERIAGISCTKSEWVDNSSIETELNERELYGALMVARTIAAEQLGKAIL